MLIQKKQTNRRKKSVYLSLYCYQLLHFLSRFLFWPQAHLIAMCVFMQHGPRAWCWESCLGCPGPAPLWTRRRLWSQAGWKDRGASWRTGSCAGSCWRPKLFTSTRTKMKPRRRCGRQKFKYTAGDSNWPVVWFWHGCVKSKLRLHINY